MSRAAADDRLGDLRGTLNRGLRLTVSVLIPAAVAFAVLGRDIAVVVFGRGNVDIDEARFIGVLLAVFAAGLVPFSAYQLQLRAFYAMADTRTPTLVNLGVNVTLVVTDLALFALLPDRLKVVGLAAGHATSFVVGLLVCSAVLSRRLGGLDLAAVVRTGVRCVLAALVPSVPAVLLVVGLTARLEPGFWTSALVLVLGGAVLAGGYLVLARRMRVGEVEEAVGPLLRRLRR